ncbi:UPF0280 family protein [Nisaea acidiphila]|uniref:UPF0280 family protein n=1 Tax=Nisaea acidiphila TaxID=1862145 RepID=A0A9J7AQ02_9PROT|nr:UPF0280 family protein [Nisaea acidiphila]UUX49303.1 UPF0280 family protein [Nisaea acidiphila]
MSAAPQASMLPDGQRLHLHHGPIDLIVQTCGPLRNACYERAAARFRTVLTGLVAELPALRSPLSKSQVFADPVARRMGAAVSGYEGIFVTPMAAVAGAVADEVLSEMIAGDDVPKAYVNNGGDIAFHLMGDERTVAAAPGGAIHISAADPVRGIATSGWRGRSHSLGIADAVTVAARSAAEADAAATLIANAVDLPDHPAIERASARDLAPDSDLGDRKVTVSVGDLSRAEIAEALRHGEALARRFLTEGKIVQASLMLAGDVRIVAGDNETALQGIFAHA